MSHKMSSPEAHDGPIFMLFDVSIAAAREPSTHDAQCARARTSHIDSALRQNTDSGLAPSQLWAMLAQASRARRRAAGDEGPLDTARRLLGTGAITAWGPTA
jgi:hypothetical protein